MQPQQNFSGSGPGSADQNDAIACTQCGAPMPREMRFCRACGNRLGEGPAEYTETVRLPYGTAAANPQFSGQYTPGMGGPLVQPNAGAYPARRRRLGFSGMTWMWIILGLFFASGGLMSALVRNVPRVARISGATTSAPRSYFGVDEFKDAANDTGATFDVASPPNGPADKAGLVGGDIITSYDGHQVKDAGEMMDLLSQTPIGKTVAVIYMRDGNYHNTQMITISDAEMKRLQGVYDNRPEGKGKFGFQSNRTKAVSNPETRVFGVRMDQVDANGPADLFGIKVGDIITDWDKVPIRTSDELLSRVRRALPKGVVDIGILRDGQPMRIKVTIGRA
jgi:S1-C subfamily serine protease